MAEGKPPKKQAKLAHAASDKQSLDLWILQDIATEPDTVATKLKRMKHDTTLLWIAKELLAERKVVGFMGGHRRVARGEQDYATCARLARQISRQGCVVLQGGGPGAMEASALGAYFSEFPDEDLDAALEMLSKAPDFNERESWLGAAIQVLERFPAKSNSLLSLGTPTWVYGNEPTNVFSTLIAKCFSNALREEFLTAQAKDAVFFFPGSMGTFQEAFQIGCLVHYDLSTCKLVFVGKEFWLKETHIYAAIEDWAVKQSGKWDKQHGLLTLLDNKEKDLLQFASDKV